MARTRRWFAGIGPDLAPRLAPRLARGLALGLALGLAAAPIAPALAAPAAAEWAPAPFAVPVGSRWQVRVSDSTSDSLRGTDRTLSYRFDLTYGARAGEGYGIRYVLKEVEASGNAPSVPVARAAVEALKDIEIRGVTDASGRPIRVENEAEVAAAVRAIGDRYVKALSGTPQLESLVRRVFDELASAHGAAAAEAYLAPLPELAGAQDTALRPGEEQRSESALPSPFGGAIRSVKVLALAPDPRPALFTLVESETLDPASLKEAIAALTQKLAPGGGVSAEALRSSLPQITLSITRTRRITVEGGMARALSTQEVTKAQFAGRDGERTRTVEVRVSPAP